jgi:general secretion pathway protein K
MNMKIVTPCSPVNQRGSALIITLLVITILTGLVVDFVYEVYVDSSALSNWTNAQRASTIADSGQTLGAKFIKNIAGLSYTDSRYVEFPVPLDLGPGVFLTTKIEDENAKFNINNIIYPNGLTNEAALLSLKKLLEYLNINPSVSLSIADWIDPDSEPRLFNSEDDAKNTFLWSIDELQLIEGIDKDVFSAIGQYVTVHSNNLININTADLPIIMSLSNDMTEDLAGRIIEFRKTTPFENIGAVGNVSGLESIAIEITSRITVKAYSFRVTSRATVNEITRITESVMDRLTNIQFWREG